MEKFKKGLFWFFNSFIWLAVLFLAIDLTTKLVIVANRDYIYSLPNSRIDLIPGFLGITYVINTNAAFGIGVGSNLANRILYIVLAALASAVLIAVYVKKYKLLNRLHKACMMLILVGAVGNLIDRIFFTSEMLSLKGLPLEVGVVDWIDFYGIWRYVFNIADSCIVVGVIMLVVVLIVEEVKGRKKEAKQVITVNELNEKKAQQEQAQKENEESTKEEK